MSPVLLSVVAALAVMLVSLSGVIFTSRFFGTWVNKNLTYLATFAAGVLAILAYHLIEEALHEAESVAIVAASVIAGAIVLEIIHLALPHEHHHHGMPEDHAHTAVDGRRVLVSDAVHNITDGFIIIPAFFIDWTIGVAATAGILLHEFVQEVSEFFVLREAGYSTRKALTLNFAVSATLLVGVALALILVSFENVLALLAGFAAGGFLSVVLRDLLPHAVSSIKSHGYLAVHVIAALLGAVLMLGVITLVPDERAEEAHIYQGLTLVGHVALP